MELSGVEPESETGTQMFSTCLAVLDCRKMPGVPRTEHQLRFYIIIQLLKPTSLKDTLLSEPTIQAPVRQKNLVSAGGLIYPD